LSKCFYTDITRKPNNNNKFLLPSNILASLSQYNDTLYNTDVQTHSWILEWAFIMFEISVQNANILIVYIFNYLAAVNFTESQLPWHRRKISITPLNTLTSHKSLMKQIKKNYITFLSNGFPKSQARICVPVVCLSVASRQVGGIRTSGVTVGILKMARVRKAGSPKFVTSTSICRVGCSPRTNSSLQFRRHNSNLRNKI
jgi:hypothetical protein